MLQQLRLLEDSLPVGNKVIRTQIANCQSTGEAWTILQTKFGNSDELLQNRMSVLEEYKPPAHAKTRYHKFVSHLNPESQTRWVQNRSMTKAFNPRISDCDMFNDWLPGEEKLLKQVC